jgi:hypothetical protein
MRLPFPRAITGKPSCSDSRVLVALDMDSSSGPVNWRIEPYIQDGARLYSTRTGGTGSETLAYLSEVWVSAGSIPRDYTITATHPFVAEASDTATFTSILLDISVDSNYDGVIDDSDNPIKESAGGFTATNVLRRINLTFDNGSYDVPPGEIVLKVVSGGGKIILWEDLEKEDPVVLDAGGTIRWSPSEMPNTVYAEGIEASTTLRDIEVILEYEAYSSSFELQDRIRLTVIEVKLNAYEAWRGNDDTMIEDTEKIVPGMLITPNIDDIELDDPLEAKLIFKGIPSSFGLTRHVTFSESGRVEFRFSDESVGPTVPTASVNLNGIVSVTADFTRDVAMHNPELWGTGLNSVVVTYIVRDAQGKEIGCDAVRLLRPVVIPIGDSLTYGLMREATPSNTFRTPRWDFPWTVYPNADAWTSLPAPWGNAVNRETIPFQGFRGHLAALLPGFHWTGEDTNGHGPWHMGYPDGKINQISNRWIEEVLSTDGCYAVVIYLAGMNDINADSSPEAIFSQWADSLQFIRSIRNGKGKTLFVAVTLPQMGDNYGNEIRHGNIVTLNENIRDFETQENSSFKHVVADIENVSHDPGDDGLHFFSTGYCTIAQRIKAAVTEGFK